MNPILETQQLVSAVFLGLREYKERAPDGVSKGEVFTLLLSLAGPVKDAAIGIQSVHRELLHLTEDSRAELLQQIGDELVAAGVSHRYTDFSLMILDWVIRGAEIASFIATAPPAAIPADQPATEYP